MTTLTQWLVYPILIKYLFIEPFLASPDLWARDQEQEQQVIYIDDEEDEEYD